MQFGEQRLAVSDGAVQIVDSVGASIGAGFSCVWRFFLSPHVTKCHALLPPTLGLIDTLSCLSACLLTTPSSACVTAAVCVVKFTATPFSGLLSFFPDQQLRLLRLICFSDRRFAQT